MPYSIEFSQVGLFECSGSRLKQKVADRKLRAKVCKMTSVTVQPSVTDLEVFVPDLLRRNAANLVGDGRATARLNLIYMTIDVVGFSHICAKAVEASERKVEAIAVSINDLHASVFEIIRSQGGSIHAVSGDAIFAEWDTQHSAHSNPAQSAKACADIVQAAFARGDIKFLGQSVGARIVLDYGEVILGSVGASQGDRHIILSGNVAVELGENLAAAAEDNMRLTTRFLEFSKAQVALTGEGTSGPATTPPRNTPTATPQLANQIVESFVPAWMRKIVRAADADWLAELRRTTILFARLTDQAGTNLSSLTRLDALFESYQEAVSAAGGHIMPLIRDDKGLIVLSCWGLRGAMYEDNAVRALRAGHALLNAATQQDWKADIGVRTGMVFVGAVGDAGFRQYTVLGGAVNAAAAMMMRAQGHILVDVETAQLANQIYDFEIAETVLLKGKAASEPLYSPISQSAKRRRKYDVLVGREKDLRLSQNGLEGTQRATWIFGEPGIGKSHLTNRLCEDARDAGTRVLYSGAENSSSASLLFIWREIFATLFNAPTDEEVVLTKEEVLPLLAGIPNAEELLPILRSVLNLDVSETTFMSELTPERRGIEVTSFLSNVYLKLTDESPSLLVLDDIQWIDTASWALLATVRRRKPDTALLINSRLMDLTRRSADAQFVLNPRNAQQVPLSGLSLDGTAALLRQSLSVHNLPKELAPIVHARTNGHPFYTRELIQSLLHDKIIHVSGDRCHIRLGLTDLRGVAFPDTVQSAIGSRYARMEFDAQLTLKVASVVGRQFSLDLVEAAHPTRPGRIVQQQHLAAAEELQLIHLVQPGLYEFTHALARDAIYDLLLTGQRQKLHRNTAQALRSFANENETPAPAILAHHYENAGETQKAIAYLEEAAEASIAAQTFRETAEYLLRALRLNAERNLPKSDFTIGDWHQQIAKALFELGQVHLSAKHYENAIWLLTSDVRAPCGTARGIPREFWRLKTQPMCPAVDDERRTRLLVAAECCVQLSFLVYEIQQLFKAIHFTFLGTNLAKLAGGDSKALARSDLNLAIASFSLPFAFDGERHLRQGLAIADRQSDNPSLRLWAYHTASCYCEADGRFDEAISLAKDAIDAAEQTDLDRDREQAAAQLANCLRRVGRYRDAVPLDQRTLAIARNRGVLQTQLWALNGLTRCLMWLGETAQHREMLAVARGYLSDPDIRKNSSDNNYLAYSIAEALAALEDGTPEDLFNWLEEAVAVYDGIRDPQVYMTDMPGAVLDLILPTWYRTGDARCLGLAKRMVKNAKKTARLYRAARCHPHIARGDLALMRGKPQAARRHWQKAFDLAQQNTLKINEAHAHYRLLHLEGRVAEVASVPVFAELPDGFQQTWRLLDRFGGDAY